ncbi:MAG TPA: hypothetical protein VJ843_04360 [Candidatus Saccharimonadales bacterium]|nr:hypothetical protein [Candidatus Saccharimonadales bacterium]
MIDYRVVRRMAGTDDPNVGTVIAWGNAPTSTAIRQNPPLHLVQQDSGNADPNYKYILQVYVRVAGYCLGWLDVRTLSVTTPCWETVTRSRVTLARPLLASDVLFPSDSQYFTYHDVPLVLA